MARRKQAPKDLTGIRPRGGRYQIRLFGGQDPVTGKQVMLTGSAEDEDSAIKLRDKFRRQVAEATSARTSVTLGYLLDEWLAGHQVEETTRTSYRVAIENFIKPAVGDTSLSRLAQLGARPFEQLYAELRVCRRRCKGRTFIEHRTHRDHKCDKRCAPHQCRPLSVSSVRECHAVLSGALNAALRWGWIAVNPLEAVKCPRQQHPQPDPPSAEDAAKIVSAAWEQDADWGTFVWLAFITGARRGELLGLAWEHLDLSAGLLTIRRNLVRQNGKALLKETKTHQMRIVSLDPDTIAILTVHKQSAQRHCTELGTTLDAAAFVFSTHLTTGGTVIPTPLLIGTRGRAGVGGVGEDR
ncbi:MAG: site-specific integrase [Actinomycetota bacterium]|nr:site-specific integrase [Actinomycetota bacterium]